jgi:predicted PurR-regulated permease PerM
MAESTRQEKIGQLLFYGAMVLLLYLAYRVMQPFLVPLGWATVLVVCFYPWHARLAARWGAGRAAAASTAAMTLVLIVPTVLVMIAFVNEAISTGRALEEARKSGQLPLLTMAQRGWEWVQQRLPAQVEFDPGALAQQAVEKVGAFLAAQAGKIVKNVAVFVFDLFIVIFAMFYIFRDGGAMVERVRELLPFEAGQREELLAEVRELIFASVTASVIIAAVQGLLGGLAFAWLGLRAPIFWGVMMGFFSLLPVVGAWLVWVPAALYLFATGSVARGIILVALGVGVIGMVDNFLRPILISGKSRLNGLVIFISVLGGVAVFGMLGLVLGPIVMATVWSMLHGYSRQPAASATTAAGGSSGAAA